MWQGNKDTHVRWLVVQFWDKIMQLTLKIGNERITEIITDLERGREMRPPEYRENITTYWAHHLAQMKVEKSGNNEIKVSGESGFYFPGMTYSGSDFLNTIYKRFGLMSDITRSKYDLSIPKCTYDKLGFNLRGKCISFDFLRSIHHAKNIIESAAVNDIILKSNLNVLEIGSGTGIQALVFKLLFKDSTYFLVDFPETLALAETFLSLVMPQSKMLFFSQWNKQPELLLNKKYDFVFIPNYATSRLPSNFAHLALNTVSMQEMNYATIAMYFSEIRRILTEPALFYQCNRDKRMDGEMIEVKI